MSSEKRPGGEPPPARPRRGRAGKSLDLLAPLGFPFTADGRLVWPAIAVMLVGTLASVVAWKSVEAFQNTSDKLAVETTASRMARASEKLLEQQLTDLEGLLRIWESFPVDTEERWRANAQLFISIHPSILLIATTEVPSDLTGDELKQRAPELLALLEKGEDAPASSAIVVGVAEAVDWFRALNRAHAGNPESEFIMARLSALEGSSVRLMGPVPMSDEEAVIEVDLATSPAARRRGLMTAIFRPAAIFEQLVAARTTPYAFSVDAKDTPLFRFETPAAEAPPALVAEDRLRVRKEQEWTLRVAPSLAIMDDPRRQIGGGILAAGLLLSALMALIVQLAHVSRVRATALGRANSELLARLQLIEGREAEIRELNQNLETRVKERTAKLDEVIQELETYNYSVSHDLRSPLGAILNFSAILNEDYKDQLDDAGKEHLRRITRAAQTAISMMDSLVSFSRLGRDKLKYEPLRMPDLFNGTLRDLVAAGNYAGIELVVGALPTCEADTAMIRLVVVNLLSNALKFSRESKPPKIEVGGWEKDGECVYYVRDNGVGFDSRNATQIFNVFERLHSRDQFEGHGIGLAIVRRVVERHGGRVWAEATPGKGATFYFSMPKERSVREGSS